jgi:hypothetical protein
MKGIITLALAAIVSIGVTPAFAQVSSEVSMNNDNLIADCMIQQKRCYKRVYKPAKKKVARKKVAIKKVETIAPVATETEQTIEKPAVVEAPAPVVEQQTEVAQPAVCAQTPVIIDRFEKRHRSLIHLGLFPFSLFGQ